VFAQLVSSDSSPACRGVPRVPLCRSAGNAHRLNLFTAGRSTTFVAAPCERRNVKTGARRTIKVSIQNDSGLPQGHAGASGTS
jgi:hypothetical protein